MIRRGSIAAIIAVSFAWFASGDAMAGATVSGTIKLEFPGGKKPGRKKIQMAADPVCAGKHTAGPALSAKSWWLRTTAVCTTYLST